MNGSNELIEFTDKKGLGLTFETKIGIIHGEA